MDLVMWEIPAPSCEFRVIAVDGYRIVVRRHGTPGGPPRPASRRPRPGVLEMAVRGRVGGESSQVHHNYLQHFHEVTTMLI